MSKAKIERPHRRRKAHRPAEILAAAFDEFSMQGFAGTRLETIAARAGITKGTIYVYFDSKETLFVAALKEQIRPVLDNLAAITRDMRAPALDLLKVHLDFTAAHIASDAAQRDVIRILMAEGKRFPALSDLFHAEVAAPMLASVREIIRHGVERGEFRRSAAEDFPHLVVAPVMLAVNWLSIFGARQGLDVRGLFEAAFDIFARGLVSTQ